MAKTIQYEHYPKLRKRKVTKTYEQGYGQNGGVSSLGTTYEDTDSDGVLDTVVKNSPRSGAFKRTVSVVGRSYLPQPASTCTATSPCVPVIASLAPTNITAHGATLNASLTSTGGIDPAVTIYMGTIDRGEVPFGWSEGSWPLGNIGVGPITQVVSGLSTGTTYYYRVRAENPATTTSFGAWSGPQSFLTVAQLPVITGFGGGPTGSFSVAENTSTSTIVGYPSATGGGITYTTSGADSSAFILDAVNGYIRFAAIPDYENPADANTDNNYQLTVIATNTVGSDSIDLTITVTDVLEVDQIAPALVTPSTTIFGNTGESTGTLAYGTDTQVFYIWNGMNWNIYT